MIKNNTFSIINKGYNQAGYAYNIIKNKDSYVLNYHVVDTPKIIIDDLNVNESLRCDNKLNTSISQILSFKKNKISPCVTISLNIGRNGEVKSFCVFNTPAVRECHGWKLPEFLAMGKAIITTPLSNDLPVELVENQDLLIVNNEKDLQKAIESLLYDKALRQKLEQSARQYWDKIANPKSVILSILQNINIYN